MAAAIIEVMFGGQKPAALRAEKGKQQLPSRSAHAGVVAGGGTESSDGGIQPWDEYLRARDIGQGVSDGITYTEKVVPLGREVPGPEHAIAHGFDREIVGGLVVA